MHTYTIAYSVPATNVSTATLALALGVIPRDVDTEALLGLTLVTDSVGVAGPVVTRTIVYNSAPGPIGDPDTGDVLTNFYTETFSQGIASRVVAAPVVFA